MRIAILSDLHIGMHRQHLVQPMLDAIAAGQPEQLIIAGDLVQRARRPLFAEAKRILDQTGLPWLCVPGNHDIPLMNVPARLFWPFDAYETSVPGPREPVLDLQGTGRRIVGVNSTYPLRWRNGRITDNQLARVEWLSDDDPIIVVQHHPISLLPGETKELMLNAERALAAYDAMGVEMIVSGHLHHFNIATSASGMVQVHAGSALCDRPEDPPNEFALLDINAHEFQLTRMIATPDQSQFRAQPEITLPRRR